MSVLAEKIRKKYKQALSVLLFLLAFVLMATMMPRERKFNYEFYKGRPWAHTGLTAPFRFSIYKTAEELKVEQDSALKGLKPYFNFNTLLISTQLDAFKGGFEKSWADAALTELNIASLEIYKTSAKYLRQREKQIYYHNFISSELEKTYQKGILEMPENVEIQFSNFNSVVLIKNNIAEERDLSYFYTPKTAYEFVHNAIREVIKKESDPRISDFLLNFEIEQYLKSNVLYDAISSERERNSLLNEISLTKGLVQEGELIINRGEIVTLEKYQILASLSTEYESEKGNIGIQFVWLGKLLLLIIALVLIFIFLYNFRREVLKDSKKTTFILFMVVLMFFVATTMAKVGSDSFYLIPFAVLPILLRTFYDERVAVFIHVITMLIIGFIAPNSFEFVFLNIMAGIVAIFSLTNLYRRSKFFISSILVIFTYSICYFGLSVAQEGSFSQIEWTRFREFGLNGLFILISFLLIYIVEKIFGFLSDTSLMELADTNQPLLRKLAEVAPGTFQHSLQVASLSEEAIYRIGGNPLLVRTGALYHDIGKMYDPIYFIENQTNGINPHDNLEFSDSAKVIIDHVTRGVELAHKNNLPQSIIDFIVTHHGTSTVQYFYKSYIKKFPEQEVDIRQFTYPGPKPTTKEMAVLMMADSVEAASRSMKEYTDDSISELVEKIIGSQLTEGQFEEAAITFRELAAVKEVFKWRLKNIYHARISYPK